MRRNNKHLVSKFKMRSDIESKVHYQVHFLLRFDNHQINQYYKRLGPSCFAIDNNEPKTKCCTTGNLPKTYIGS